MSFVSNMGFEIMGEGDYTTANGTPLHTFIVQANVALSDEDVFDVPIHICKERTDVALIGMDILQKCNFSHWHEWDQDDVHSLNFKLEIAIKDE